jgi:cephalosporin hydroxylase
VESSDKLIEIPYRVLKRLGLLEKSKKAIYPWANRVFFLQLISKTENFSNTKWLGQTIRQNILDLWTIQETISEIKPDFLIETGTNYGGSALYYANLFDLMSKGKVITVDIEKLHDITHPRIEFVIGSSIDEQIVERIRSQVSGTVMVVLDSNHLESHVRQEMEIYGTFVTKGSYMLVQDGVIDSMPFMADHPGPLRAIRDYFLTHDEFEIDHERCNRFLITHHPEGWLKRVK